MNEYPRWHVGVSNQVMGLADQFVASETTDGNERVIAVSDSAIQIGDGYQSLFGGKYSFMLGDGQVHTHKTRSLLGLLLGFEACKSELLSRRYGATASSSNSCC
jgi:hypothetical protein